MRTKLKNKKLVALGNFFRSWRLTFRVNTDWEWRPYWHGPAHGQTHFGWLFLRVNVEVWREYVHDGT